MKFPWVLSANVVRRTKLGIGSPLRRVAVDLRWRRLITSGRYSLLAAYWRGGDTIVVALLLGRVGDTGLRRGRTSPASGKTVAGMAGYSSIRGDIPSVWIVLPPFL